MNQLTPTEAAALARLVAQRKIEPHAIVRWESRVYVRIFSYHYVLNGEEFEPLKGMFPNTVFMQDVVHIEWQPEK